MPADLWARGLCLNFFGSPCLLDPRGARKSDWRHFVRALQAGLQKIVICLLQIVTMQTTPLHPTPHRCTLDLLRSQRLTTWQNLGYARNARQKPFTIAKGTCGCDRPGKAWDLQYAFWRHSQQRDCRQCKGMSIFLKHSKSSKRPYTQRLATSCATKRY
jgi:hypothetical protein